VTPVTGVRQAGNRRLAGVWAAKWDGRWQLAVREEDFCNRNANDHPSQVFTVKPVKVSAHAKGDPFGDTTHRF
jgi:hypothetical protein